MELQVFKDCHDMTRSFMHWKPGVRHNHPHGGGTRRYPGRARPFNPYRQRPSRYTPRRRGGSR